MRNQEPGPTDADVSPDALRAGDVVLMRSAGDFSTLVAWLGGSAYSHAALAVGDGIVVEAITKGVSKTRLADLLVDDGVARMHAWRGAAHDGTAFSEADRAAIAARARGFLEVPFAKSGLLMLGLYAAMRDRLQIDDPWLRQALMLAMRALTPDDGKQMVCSELVYRSLRDCAATPAGRLRPVILEPEPDDAPMPEVDGWKVLAEVLKMLGHKAMPEGLLASGDGRRGAVADAAALAAVHAQARELLGLPPADTSAPLLRARRAAPPAEIRDPVARQVRPRDLEVSPSLDPIGRLK